MTTRKQFTLTVDYTDLPNLAKSIVMDLCEWTCGEALVSNTEHAAFLEALAAEALNEAASAREVGD